MYYAKTQYCPKRKTAHPIWISNELIYHVIAKRSGLQMPFCAILVIDGEYLWGAEYLAGRIDVEKAERTNRDLLRRTCEHTRPLLLGLARAVMLDIALLNSDREKWNILINPASAVHEVSYFDHEKSLFGDGQEPAIGGDLGRIDPASVIDSKIADYLKCRVANELILNCLSDQDLRDVFSGLALDADSLKAAREECPFDWVSSELFGRLERFLSAWWSHLRKQLLTNSPSAFIKSILQSANARNAH